MRIRSQPESVRVGTIVGIVFHSGAWLTTMELGFRMIKGRTCGPVTVWGDAVYRFAVNLYRARFVQTVWWSRAVGDFFVQWIHNRRGRR